MRFTGGRGGNVEDRRGMRPAVVGGGLGTVVVVLLAMLFGVDPGAVLPSGDGAPAPAEQGGAPPANDEAAQFVRLVLGSTDETWSQIFRQQGGSYQEPTLVLFDGATQSGCGFAQAAVGPFYCPTDGKVYLDLGFFRELSERFGAPGDFAEAYVIAHEVGHHVQDVMGISGRVERAQRAGGASGASGLSVRLELQADCFAGVWGKRAQGSSIQLDPGDAEEALTAASAIGDDRLQMESQGYVVPDSFTHGTAEQRTRWFQRGFQSGDPAQCDTFAGTEL